MHAPEQFPYDRLRTEIRSDIRDLDRRVRKIELATARLVGWAATAAAGGSAVASALAELW